MEKIVKEYGNFFLSGVVLIILIMLLFFQIKDDDGTQGALNILGNRIRTTDMKYQEYTDFDTYAADASKTKPVITCDDISVSAGFIILSDYVHATDCNGNTLPISVVTVMGPAGTELACDENTGVNCSTPGIYTRSR